MKMKIGVQCGKRWAVRQGGMSREDARQEGALSRFAKRPGGQIACVLHECTARMLELLLPKAKPPNMAT